MRRMLVYLPAAVLGLSFSTHCSMRKHGDSLSHAHEGLGMRQHPALGPRMNS
jgi:hypothetical protein